MADKRVKVAAVEENLMFVLNGMEGGARSGWEWGAGGFIQKQAIQLFSLRMLDPAN